MIYISTNFLLGLLFLLAFFGVEKFWYSFFISLLISIFISLNKYNFLQLVLDVLILIPRVVYEAILLVFFMKEAIEVLEYKDNFEMLRKIIKITLTPKTIVFDHDEKNIYIHKIE